MKGKSTIVVSPAEMFEWCQEALDARFKQSPGQVVGVGKTSSGSLGCTGFEITLQEHPKVEEA